jgi:mannitol/fructose-specific phosphotransferase system IIA component
MAKKWIKGAIKHPGALTQRAKAAGMTMGEFMAAPHRMTEIKREVNLARTLMAMNHRRGRSK